VRIVFRTKDGVELGGAVVQNAEHVQKFGGSSTIYDFIPTTNLNEYHEAAKKGDTLTMNRLKTEIDISDIAWAEQY
jgi:hypothetical protein